MGIRLIIGGETRKHLSLLGLKEDFTAEDLHAAFRREIKRCHPDVQTDIEIQCGVKDLENKTRQLLEAKKALENIGHFNDHANHRHDLAAVEKENIFDIIETCLSCNGRGTHTHYQPVYAEACPNCGFDGWVALRCKYCDGTGVYVTPKNLKVMEERGWTRDYVGCECNKCNQGVWRIVRCNVCHGDPSHVQIGTRPVEYTCGQCKGKGYVKLDLFNPVIRPGTVAAPPRKGK